MTLDPAYDTEFFEALALQCPGVGIDPADFLLLIAGECDFVWSAKNKWGFQGMTQMGGPALRAAGWDASKMGEFCRARPVVQLPYSLSYFRSHLKRLPAGKYENAAQLWLANLAPAHLGRSDGVVYSMAKHPGPYSANRGLDVDRDGVISVDDLKAKMDQLRNGTAPGRASTSAKYATALTRLQAVYDAQSKLYDRVTAVRPAVGVVVMDRAPRPDTDGEPNT